MHEREVSGLVIFNLSKYISIFILIPTYCILVVKMDIYLKSYLEIREIDQTEASFVTPLPNVFYSGTTS